MTQPVQEPTPGRVDRGLAWRTSQLARRPAPPSSGGWTLISKIQPGTDVSEINFFDIPQGYTHAELVYTAAGTSGTQALCMYWGTDLFSWAAQYTDTDSGTVFGVGSVNESFVQLPYAVPGFDDTDDVSNYGGGVCRFPFYSRTDRAKTVISHGTCFDFSDGKAIFSTGGGQSVLEGFVGSNGAIVNLTVFLGAGDIKSDSIFELWGL